MARPLTAAMEAGLAERVYRPVCFAELNFDGGTERLHTWRGNLTVDGNVFVGLGELVGVGNIVEGGGLSAEGITLRATGLTNKWLQIARDEHVHGRTARLWFGMLDDDYALIADPDGPYLLRMDAMEITRDDETGTVFLKLQTLAVLWSQANIRRCTDEDQQNVHPGDRFFEFMPEMAEKELILGTPESASSPAARILPGPNPAPSGEGADGFSGEPTIGPGGDVSFTHDNAFDNSP